MASDGVASPMPRSLTTGAFLMHDMSPCDPYANDYGRSKSMYDPSQGPGVRDHRRRGYTSHQMMEEHKKVPNDYVSPPRRAKTENPVTSMQDPGRAQTSLEFFEGKHTTAQQRLNTITGVHDRFTPAEIVKMEKEKTAQQQLDTQRYLDDVKRSKQQAAVVADAEKRKDLEMLKTYDPWGKGSGAPKGKNALVSKERVDAQIAASATEDFVTGGFGKQGAGAPVRTGSGNVAARYHLDGDVQVNNVYRSNLGADASARYGPKDPAKVKETLEEQARQRSMLQAEERQRAAEEEKARLEHDPFNKLGKGVPPPRQSKRADPEKERKQTYAKALQSQQQAKQAQVEQDKTSGASPVSYDPWGRGVGTVERDSSGKVMKKVPSQTAINTEPTIVDLMGKPGGGNPVQDGSGRLSPRKNPAVPDEAVDQFGRLGNQAGPKDARYHKTVEILEGNTSPTNSYAARSKFLQEQKELMVQKQRETEAAKAAERVSGASPDQFFKFGQGAANPKRDEQGNIVNQRRAQSDVTFMNLDQGGGLGRKQRTEHSSALHQQLEEQVMQKKQIEQQQKEQEMAKERTHLQAAGSWQGKAGAGAPRRTENGEIHGRFGLDKEMHHEEIIDTPKVVPKEEKARYAEELAKNLQIKTQLQAESSKLTRDTSNLHAATMNETFGKPGHGAPLRSPSGKVVAQPTKLLDSDPKEYRLNARPGRLIE